MAESLRTARPDDANPTTRLLRAVPSMRALIADLKFPGIERVTPTGRLDLHGMRMTLNTCLAYLAAQGVPQQLAQSHLRHTSPMLTAVTHTDPTLLPVAGAISALPPLSTSRPDNRAPTTAPQRPSPTPAREPPKAAQHQAQQLPRKPGPFRARRGTDLVVDSRASIRRNVATSQDLARRV